MGGTTLSCGKRFEGCLQSSQLQPDYCKLFAFPLINNIIIIQLAGLFGWIGMPHAIQVLIRTLQAWFRHFISGLCYWYEDDLMAVSHKNLYINDSTIVDSEVQQLLGDGSIAKAKSQHDRCLQFLGWDFNLDTRTITLCTWNMNKLVHFFVLVWSNRQNINFSYSTDGVIDISCINIIPAYETIHSRSACHY